MLTFADFPAPAIPAENVAEWHGYIATAPNFAEAQTRMEQALRAGVDFFALERLQRSLEA